MIMRTFLLLFVPILSSMLLVLGAHADDRAAFHGSISTTPATHWEGAFVTGNGRLGALLFGKPGDETLGANHCRLFLPLGNREIVPDLAANVAELRQIIRAKGYGAAMNFFLGKAKEQGFPGLVPTDPFHPGPLVKVRQESTGAVTGYERTEDFRSGQVEEHWRDQRGEFRRRLFVSRAMNLIVFEASGPSPCQLEFPAVVDQRIESNQVTTPDWVTYHDTYKKGKGGYDAVIRIAMRDEGRGVLLLIGIVPWKTPLPKEHSEAWAYAPENPDFQHPGVFSLAPPLAESSVVAYRATEDAAALLPKLKQAMAEVRADHDSLFKPHAQQHAALFDRVTLDLGGGADRMVTTEALLDRAQKEKSLSPALMEKMFDAGRYMLICSAGEAPPNLQGIWAGSWQPAWSGDYTLDTNVQAALACACSANLPELMHGYFRLMESFVPEWRLNAKRIYGCRGIYTNARASNTALELHWGTWDGVFWTAGCGWLASFFTEYASYTGDRDFLEKRCVPLLKEIVAFYEDFLVPVSGEDRLEFIPSYNPETGNGIDATMDIAVAREVLMNLIAACRELNIEAANVPRWEALLKKLPPYSINADGELPEFPGMKVAARHRHHSQLYPCFQSFDPLFETNAELRAAARATVRTKIAGSDGGGEQSSFGRVQCGVAAAFLGMPEEAFSRLQVMAVKRSMNQSMITSHEPNGGILNTDGNGGIPQIVATMLLFSRPDRIDLLPALPSAWPSGKVTGLRARGGFEVDIEWASGKLLSARVKSLAGRPLHVRLGDREVSPPLRKGETVTLDGQLQVR